MFKKLFCFFIVIVVMPLLNNALYGQKSTAISNSEQIEFRHDNDFFLFTDRYYSSGLFLSYRKALSKGVFKANNEQIDFTINQEVYTPSQTESTNSDLFDRTYAGFSGLKTSWSTAKENQLFRTEILLGIAGLNSGAGGLQRAYHDLVGLSAPLWVEELNDSFHFNLYFNYVKEWKIAPNPFGTRIAFIPNIALGSRDIYVEPETALYFGNRKDVANSIAYNRIDTTSNEFYFALKASYRNVLYNGLIEGNLFGDDSAVLIDSRNSLWRFGFDLYRRSNSNDYKFGVRFNTRETEDSRNHQFVQLSYGISF